MATERRGRPRSELIHHAILEATRDLLIENGYARLSMDRVAARAGVGKQTVYRRWPSKAPLVTDAILDSARPAGAALPPDTGDIHRDLRVWLQGQADFLAVPRNASLVRALAAAAADDPDDAEALYRQLTGPGRDGLLARLRAAAEAGQIRAESDLDAAADALTGAVMYRVLAGGTTGTSRLRADGLLDIIMSGLRTRQA
jgi:AcrR family transcriptional regulator